MDTAVATTDEVRKVDNHQHLAGCMTAPQLLSFIRKKLKENPEDVVKVCSWQFFRNTNQNFSETVLKS